MNIRRWLWPSTQTAAVWSLSHVQLFCDPMDCGPPGSSVHRISQARILEWVAISSSTESSWHRYQTWVSCIGRWVLYHWVSWEAPETPQRQKPPPVSPPPQKVQNPMRPILDSQYFLGGWPIPLRTECTNVPRTSVSHSYWSCRWASEAHFLAWFSDPTAMSPLCLFHKFTFSNYKSNTCSVHCRKNNPS